MDLLTIINDQLVNLAILSSCFMEVVSDIGILTFISENSGNERQLYGSMAMTLLPAAPIVALILLFVLLTLITLLYNVWADVMLTAKIHLLAPMRALIAKYGVFILDPDLAIALMSSLSNLFLLLMVNLMIQDNLGVQKTDDFYFCDETYPQPECVDVLDNCGITYYENTCVLDYKVEPICHYDTVRGYMAISIIFCIISAILVLFKNRGIKLKEDIVEVLTAIAHFSEHIIMLVLCISLQKPWVHNCRSGEGTIGSFDDKACAIYIDEEYGMSGASCSCEYFLEEQDICSTEKEEYYDKLKEVATRNYYLEPSSDGMITYLIAISVVNRILLMLRMLKKRNLAKKGTNKNLSGSIGMT